MLQSADFEAAIEGLTAFKNKAQLAAYNQTLKNSKGTGTKTTRKRNVNY